MNKTLVIGDGYVGSFFKDYPETYDVWEKSRLDIREDWINLMAEYSTVVNCHEIRTGCPRTLLLENFHFAMELYEHCHKFSKKFIQISTADFFNRSFDWETNDETTEELNISSDYLLTKRVIERYLENTDALIFRIRNPFDGRVHEDNWIIKALRRKKVNNYIDTHTYLPDLKTAIETLQSSSGGLFNAVQTQTHSDLFYFAELLKLPRYKHLRTDMKRHKDIASLKDKTCSGSDVNSSKLEVIMKLTHMHVAVIQSWHQLEDKLEKRLFGDKLN